MDSLSTTTLFQGCERALLTEMGTMHGTARPADGHSSVQGALQPRCCKAPGVALTDAVLAPRELDSSLQVDESTVVGEERHELLDVTFVVNLHLPLNHCQRVGGAAPSHFESRTLCADAARRRWAGGRAGGSNKSDVRRCRMRLWGPEQDTPSSCLLP